MGCFLSRDNKEPDTQKTPLTNNDVDIKDANPNIIIDKDDQKTLDNLPDEMRKLYSHKAKHKINDNGSVTFWPTPECKPSTKKLDTNKISMKNILYDAGCSKVEALSNVNDQIIQPSKTCSFITSSLISWSEHYPFKFRAEHIWLLILQGVAIHVDQNAQKLRNKYVMHKGKKKLLIIRDNFVLGSANNDWIGVINEFAEQIDKNTVKDTVTLLNNDFSASTLTEQIAAKVTIMDICKNYFSYGMRTACGFPQITIDGTKQDWIKLKNKCIKLLNEKVDKRFGEKWGKALLPLIDRFIIAFDGNIDCLFWNSMIKRGARHGSGSWSWYTGWINILFPFIQQNWNGYCVPYSINEEYVQTKRGRGNDVNKYPSGIASAPVEWNYYGKKLDLKFLAGFVGYNQNKDTLEITPNIAWCIAHKK